MADRMLMAMVGSRAALWQQLVFALVSLNIVLLLKHQIGVCDARVNIEETTTLIFNVCSNDTIPTAEELGDTVPYATNLAQLKASLTSSATSHFYDISTAGSGDAVIYGTYQCRGDLNSSECSTCIALAADRSADRCPQAVNARIELAACSFYYQNTSIVPNFTQIGAFQSGSASNFSFIIARRQLLQNVSAAAPTAPHFYSSGSDEGVVYAVAQCYGYLTPDECRKCVNADAPLFYGSGLSTGGRTFYGSCMLRFESTLGLFFNPTPESKPAPAPAPAPRIGSSPLPDFRDGVVIADPSARSKKLVSVIGVAVGCSVVVLASCGFLLHRKWASNACEDDGEEYIKLQRALEQHQIRLFSPQQLKDATKNFQNCNKLGEGGFGSVYKGILQDGKAVAIKKLTHSSHHGERQFWAEIETMSSLQHRNLMSLSGCCRDGSNKYLVYEYLSNQSLDKHIFEEEGKRMSMLPWSTRQKIILGTAKGLMYLHHGSKLRIIHRDIKASNILLDENLQPKIADFGLARLLAFDQKYLSTVIAGTVGYLAPECITHGQLTDKSDVYSFGMVVLEILSGRRVRDACLPLEQQSLLNWAWMLYEDGRAMDLMDPQLKSEYTEEEVSRLILLSLLCTQTMAVLRPAMSKVVAFLEGEGEMMGTPRKPECQTCFDDLHFNGTSDVCLLTNSTSAPPMSA